MVYVGRAKLPYVGSARSDASWYTPTFSTHHDGRLLMVAVAREHDYSGRATGERLQKTRTRQPAKTLTLTAAWTAAGASCRQLRWTAQFITDQGSPEQDRP